MENDVNCQLCFTELLARGTINTCVSLSNSKTNDLLLFAMVTVITIVKEVH